MQNLQTIYYILLVKRLGYIIIYGETKVSHETPDSEPQVVSKSCDLQYYKLFVVTLSNPKNGFLNDTQKLSLRNIFI